MPLAIITIKDRNFKNFLGDRLIYGRFDREAARGIEKINS